jgi:hypothetical protein
VHRATRGPCRFSPRVHLAHPVHAVVRGMDASEGLGRGGVADGSRRDRPGLDAYSVLGAICVPAAVTTPQIGSTPCWARYSSM